MKRRLVYIALILAIVGGMVSLSRDLQAQGSLQQVAEAYFSEGPRTMTAADLYENLNDGDPENDPTIISLRSAEDYAKGHIPGAVNVSVKELFTMETLSKIPPERDVVLVCYTGQTAGQATAGLNMLGYEAYSLLFGMSSWTTDPDVFAKRFNPDTHASDYSAETEANVLEGSYGLPTPLAASVAAAAEAYFGEGPRTIQAADLYENLNDGDPDNDPTIISLRSAEDYAKGHIPGAVNVSVKELFSEENLAAIPPDKDVVLVCYTGQTAGQATAGLNMLGYEAYSLLFGMSSWTTDPEVYAKRFNPETHASDYRVESEANALEGTYEVPFTTAAAGTTTTAAVSVGDAAEAYFSEGPRTMAAADLYENLNDGDPENDPTIISLRSAEDYAGGHIPGAVNVSVKELFTTETLSKIPPDKDVVLVCYTGQTAGQATAGMNMLGYDAYSLLFGMSSWTPDPDVFAKRFNPEVHTGDYTIDTEAYELEGSYGPPPPLASTVAAAAEAYFGEGPRTMAAADLYENLNDGDPENDPTIICLRSAEDYAKGHIPGAVNVSVKELFSEANLAAIPPEKDVVLVCYTGQTAGQATAGLNMLGYEAYSLLFGMSSWTTDPEVYAKRFNPEVHAGDYTVDTETHELTGSYELPFVTTVTGAVGIEGAARAYFSEGPRTMAAADLYENLNDGDPENDPTIISLRSAEDYAKGHIPGAVNVSVKELFTMETLSKIPPDKDVVLVCYTGQTAGHAAAAMNMLGYQAYSLLFGMSSWTPDPEVYAKRFDPEKHAGDYTIDTEAHELVGSYGPPTPPATSVVEAADAYFSDGVRTIEAAIVYEHLNDGDPDNDPTIISLRSAEDYAKGHLPGSVNVSVTELFSEESLAAIPPDKAVVLVCYTGQTAGQAAAAMNMMGYDACSLLFGMSSWTTDPEVYAKRFNPEVHTGDYMVDIEAHELTGSHELPTPLAAAGPAVGPTPEPTPAAEMPVTQAAATNCISCHTDKASVQALAVEEEEEKVSEESTGEG